MSEFERYYQFISWWKKLKYSVTMSVAFEKDAGMN